ncbi:MAG: GPR1/FUN34/YaaH family transporter, partial [Candidatus Dormibacteria bacterium]
MAATGEFIGTAASPAINARLEVKEPVGVHVGAGGNPIVLGLACFAVAATCLGMVLIGVVPLTALAIIVPIIAGATGFFQIIATVWAVVLGQTFVAVVFGLFSGFWLSLTLLLMGLGHNWYGIAAADIAHSQALYFIAWTVMFFALLIPSLRLPAVYPAIVADVVLALIVVTAAVWNNSENSFKLTGWILLGG